MAFTFSFEGLWVTNFGNIFVNIFYKELSTKFALWPLRFSSFVTLWTFTRVVFVTCRYRRKKHTEGERRRWWPQKAGCIRSGWERIGDALAGHGQRKVGTYETDRQPEAAGRWRRSESRGSPWQQLSLIKAVSDRGAGGARRSLVRLELSWARKQEVSSKLLNGWKTFNGTVQDVAVSVSGASFLSTSFSSQFM